jgi:hypothetical protein
MELGAAIEALDESEINCSVSAFWDAGIKVQLGDEDERVRCRKGMQDHC